MTKIETTSEIFWTAFKFLSQKARTAIIEKMLRDKEFREDLIDIVIIEQRLDERSIRLEDYLKKKNRKGSCWPLMSRLRNLQKKNCLEYQQESTIE